MSDKLTQDYADPNRIDIGDTVEVLYWSKSLNASPEEVRFAVATVGPFVEKVCEFLQKK
ncbi:MAG: DUF3606 domain-containing protein [Betaproteobacteria bacterium]